MRKLSLLDFNYIFFIKDKELYYPFIAINIEDKNIYLNYLPLNEHSSLHFGKKPFIKHSRKNYETKNIFERRFEKHDFGVIDNYLFKPRSLIEKNLLRAYPHDIISHLDNNRQLVIIPLEEYEHSGWCDNNKGLGFIEFYLPDKDPNYQNEMQHYIENIPLKNTFSIALKNESSLVIILYSKPFKNEASDCSKTIYTIRNMHSFADNAEIFMKPMTKKYDEKVIVSNTGFKNGLNKNAKVNIEYFAVEIEYTLPVNKNLSSHK